METEQEELNKIKSSLGALEKDHLLNHPALVKIWEGVRELEEVVKEKKGKCGRCGKELEDEHQTLCDECDDEMTREQEGGNQ